MHKYIACVYVLQSLDSETKSLPIDCPSVRLDLWNNAKDFNCSTDRVIKEEGLNLYV